MSYYADNDYIPLWWDSTPDAYYVKGHIDFEKAKEIVSLEEGFPVDCLGDVSHCYARWEFPPDYLRGDMERCLRAYPTQGRGCFKVTECLPAKGR